MGSGPEYLPDPVPPPPRRRPGPQAAERIVLAAPERDGLPKPLVRRLPGRLLIDWCRGDNRRAVRVTVCEDATVVELMAGLELVAASVADGLCVESGQRHDLLSLVRAGIDWMMHETPGVDR